MEAVVQITEEGRETLRRLHIENQRRIKAALKKLAKGSETGKPLTGRLRGFYSHRVGKYRVIYSIENERIIVHHVGHRGGVYEKGLQKTD